MKRNYGIDGLRILSMFMVVILHVLGQGGILRTAAPSGMHYWSGWLLEVTCYCAANCFALISGYVMLQSKPKASRMLELWLQTLFYTIIPLMVYWLVKGHISIKAIMNALFPITRRHYWYISSYLGLLILMPLLNAALIHTPKKVLSATLLVGFVFFSFLPTILDTDSYALGGGYSLIWLCLLYLCGGYIHKFDSADLPKKSTAWHIFFAMVCLTFLSKITLSCQTILPLNTSKYQNLLVSYTSPTMVVAAIALLICFSKASPNPKTVKVIQLLSPAALGVYLLHVGNVVWYTIIDGFAIRFLQYHWTITLLLTLLSALLIYIICSIVELIRIKLYKLMGIKKLSAKLDGWVEKIFADQHTKV